MNKVTLKGHLFSARRESDQAGDDGHIIATNNPYNELGEPGTIVVGKRLMVGNITGTWFLLSTVQEILEINEEKTVCKIRTRNSVYTIKAF